MTRESMKRTTIMADESLILEAKHLAEQEGRTFNAVVQDALREYLANHRPRQRRISFAGIGRSGKSLSFEEQEELIRNGLGWDSLSPDQQEHYERLGFGPRPGD
jgi:hypothetical protein